MIENVVMRGGAALTKDSATVLFSGWESSDVDRVKNRGVLVGEDAHNVKKEARDPELLREGKGSRECVKGVWKERTQIVLMDRQRLDSLAIMEKHVLS